MAGPIDRAAQQTGNDAFARADQEALEALAEIADFAAIAPAKLAWLCLQAGPDRNNRFCNLVAEGSAADLRVQFGNTERINGASLALAAWGRSALAALRPAIALDSVELYFLPLQRNADPPIDGIDRSKAADALRRLGAAAARIAHAEGGTDLVKHPILIEGKWTESGLVVRVGRDLGGGRMDPGGIVLPGWAASTGGWSTHLYVMRLKGAPAIPAHRRADAPEHAKPA